MAEGIALFDVYRFNPEKDSGPHRKKYEVELQKNMTVLDGLRQVQERRDGFLAFRASCQGGQCGACAMRINGRVRLACETRIETLGKHVIHIDPLPNLTVIRDLVVDMGPFWQSYEQIRPWLSPDVHHVEREHPQAPGDRERMDAYTGCILCGACYAVCPAVRRTPWFVGPAALAKVFRFVADSRDGDAGERIEALNSHAGVWGCDTTFCCIRVCPKGVPTTHAITAMRRKLVMKKIKGILSLIPLERESTTG
ncbi:MAG: succinate dehydrogenase/fumarate reductase iron-sulfur subunit [Planctomycetes bacterium]|nr:succinate dehydrogenase/fumarate reductase iron-sulfur subunit [Planctomycetota bacterium]